jgi:DNA-binding NarL/FixJ family response regulator
MVRGASNAAIAEQLVIKEGTVKSHVKHILRKLGAVNRAETISRYMGVVSR